jgi:hypothetical protein
MFLVQKFCVKFAQVSKIGFVAFIQVLVSERFHLAKFAFSGLRSFWSSQVSKIGFKFFGKSFSKFGSGFFARSISSGINHGLQSQFFGIGFGKFSAFTFW